LREKRWNKSRVQSTGPDVEIGRRVCETVETVMCKKELNDVT